MKALKVFTTVFVILVQLLTVVAPVMAESHTTPPVRGGEKQQLLVTAYYSPLPNQSFYIKGTYEADIRLNGRGTNGADGTEVYIGMLAAPKTYAFGTRVRIPGLGVGEVHDRGGAILAKKNYDRIDVWMGHGEEGLARALNWGARLVEGEVYRTPRQVEPGLDYGWVSSTLPAAYVAKLQARTVAASLNKPVAKPVTPKSKIAEPASEAPEKIQKIVSLLAPEEDINTVRESEEIKRLEQNRLLLVGGLGKNAEGEDVKSLQRMLWDLGFYKDELNGTYDEATMDAVFRFQMKNEVIGGENETGAGYFGKKTLEALLGALDKKIVVLTKYPKTVQTWVPAKKVLPQIASLKAPQFNEQKQSLYFAENLLIKNVKGSGLEYEMGLNDDGENVTMLQNLLIKKGFLAEGLNTGYYGNLTAAAVLALQIEREVVGDAASVGAGRVGPETLLVLNRLR